MSSSHIFVFVVCGADEHIDTLNFSIRYLKHFSKNEIVVVTDLRRNNKAIAHDNILDISTPPQLSHHQSSIYLKTGLHKFLDLSNCYCYLDSDVIAIDSRVDSIFSHFSSPIIFGSDHCALRAFSPYAINCNCFEHKREKYSVLDQLQEKHNPNLLIKDAFLLEKQRVLINTFYIQKRNPLVYSFLALRYIMSPRFFKLNSDFYFDKKKKVWYYRDGRAVLYSVEGYYKKIEKESIFRWDKRHKLWLDDTGENAYIAFCNHLTESIKLKFNISVTEKNWQHWNGGVFLFNRSSVPFMESWHQKTLAIFEDPAWKTRDQGTLIATAWEFGLSKHTHLPQEYNFIADYYKQNITFDKEKGFSTDKFKTIINPFFIHVYHEFGKKGWDVWDAITSLIPEKEEDKV